MSWIHTTTLQEQNVKFYSIVYNLGSLNYSSTACCVLWTLLLLDLNDQGTELLNFTAFHCITHMVMRNNQFFKAVEMQHLMSCSVLCTIHTCCMEELVVLELDLIETDRRSSTAFRCNHHRHFLQVEMSRDCL